MTEPLWIFAYGSLIWDPGFTPAEVRRAELTGWRRSFCMYSVCFRGTPEAPGLVLALDAEAEARCAGLALRVSEHEADRVLSEVRARELITDAYLERNLPVRCEDGSTVQALAYVINPDGPQYCALSHDEQVRVIASAQGDRGPNREYLWATADRLNELGLADPELDELSRRVRAGCATKA